MQNYDWDRFPALYNNNNNNNNSVFISSFVKIHNKCYKFKKIYIITIKDNRLYNKR